MPIYPGRRAGTFRVVVWSRGRPHEEIVQGTKTQAKEHEARMRIELQGRGRLTRRIAPVFSEFSTEEYAPHARARLGADTWRNARKYVVATLTEHFGPHRLDALTAVHVDGYVRVRQAAGVKASVINGELQVLRTMLRFAAELGYPIAALKLRLLPAPQRRVRAWSAAEVARLCATATGLDPEMLPMILAMLNTGMRKGETIAAPWSWVDWSARILAIAPYDDWTPKNRRPREVPLSDALLDVLRAMPQRHRWIFPTRTGDRRTIFPGERFRAIVKSAGLTGGPHTCRHTFASMFLAAGGSLFELSKLLGHSAARTTELYAHLLPEHLERTRNVVNVGATGSDHGDRHGEARPKSRAG